MNLKFGSMCQRVGTVMKLRHLSRIERARLRTLAWGDELRLTDYVIERHDGVLYADNGYSLVYDLTNDKNTSADSIGEAARKARKA